MTETTAAKLLVFRKILLMIPLLLLLIIPAGVAAQQSGTTQYVYDADGRLAAVIAPDGSVAVYQYDAAGNLTAISRSAGTVIVNDFSPLSGSAGTVVTIRGGGFNPDPAQNTVVFNGVPSVIQSASATQIVVTVPDGAHTGPIGVSNSNGSASSRTEFIISTDLRIISFTPNIGTQSTTVVIEGNGFDTDAVNNEVLFNNTSLPAEVIAASETQLTVRVPVSATTGKVRISNSLGNVTSAQDFFIPPSGYAAANVMATGSLTAGENYNLSVPSFPKLALLAFDGTAGKKANLSVLQNSGSGLYEVRAYAPNGQLLLARFSSQVSKVFEFPNALPSTGRYTILIIPPLIEAPPATWNATIRLNFFDDVFGTISPETSPVGVTITDIGQDALLTFNGVQEQEVSLLMRNMGISAGTLSILKPDGSLLASDVFSFSDEGYINRIVLPTTGVYKVFLNPNGAEIGSCQLHLYTVTDLSQSLTLNQPAVPIEVSIPGQNVRLTLNAAQGQRLFLNFTDVNGTGYYGLGASVKVYRPNGTLIANANFYGYGKGIDVLNLPETGLYTIDLDLDSSSVGSFSVSAGTTGVIVLSQEVRAFFLTPGQTSSLNYAGSQGDEIRVSTENPVSGTVRIYAPDGTLFASSALGTSIRHLSLPANGTYRIEVTLDGNNTGTIGIAVYDDFNGS